MPSGYLRGNSVDVGWWVSQIRAAEEYRKKVAFQPKWDTWRRYYRGEWSGDILPVNLFFSMLRMTVPRVYFRNPTVSITPGMPGFLEMAFAQVTNRLDNQLLAQMALKDEMKAMVQDAFLFGTAIGKLGYGGKFTPSPIDTQSEIPTTRAGHNVEYDPRTSDNTPWFARVRPENFLVPDGLENWRESRWVAHRVERPLEDVKADTRFSKKARENVPATSVEGTMGTMAVERPVEMAELFEIRDNKTGRVLVLAPDGSDAKSNRILYNEQDAFQGVGLGFNFFPVVFNPNDDAFWGLPDAQVLEPQQLERNELRTLMMKHRRSTIVKILVQEGKIADEEAQKILSEDVNAVVKVKGVPDNIIKVIQSGQIPQDFFQMDSMVTQDVRETVGFSRNQLGEFQSRRGDTSATEAAIVEQASEIRVDERRDILADVLVNVVKMMNAVIFPRWSAEQVAEVVGPGGAQVWVRFKPADLRLGHYVVKVDPDSQQPKSRQARQQKALGLYEVLKMNPLIDPIALTKYLLTEMGGVEMDDLMRALPEQPAQENPVSLPQFAGLIQNGVRQAQNGAATPPRVLQ